MKNLLYSILTLISIISISQIYSNPADKDGCDHLVNLCKGAGGKVGDRCYSCIERRYGVCAINQRRNELSCKTD
jgi:hypothetical protein